MRFRPNMRESRLKPLSTHWRSSSERGSFGLNPNMEDCIITSEVQPTRGFPWRGEGKERVGAVSALANGLKHSVWEIPSQISISLQPAKPLRQKQSAAQRPGHCSFQTEMAD